MSSLLAPSWESSFGGGNGIVHVLFACYLDLVCDERIIVGVVYRQSLAAARLPILYSKQSAGEPLIMVLEYLSVDEEFRFDIRHIAMWIGGNFEQCELFSQGVQ